MKFKIIFKSGTSVVVESSNDLAKAFNDRWYLPCKIFSQLNSDQHFAIPMSEIAGVIQLQEGPAKL